MLSLCDHWEFTEEWSGDFLLGEGSFETVRLPHTVREMPLHYGDHRSYEMICGYRRKLEITGEHQGKRLFLQFDGAAHIAEVYVNGRLMGTHRCGYTAFRVEITDQVVRGSENLIAVKLDTRENPQVPPFGFAIDYLTYGGLYREVWLDVREQALISDVYVTTPTTDTVHVELTTEGADICRVSVCEEGGKSLLTREFSAFADLTVPGVKPWTLEEPCRYVLHCELLDGYGNVQDIREVKFGFRVAHFRPDGFYLNREKIFLRGLNRHQCYPYVGYAAPERLQREDARILKEELGCTAVRTSHYPQSQYFIDECDRIGLLVFTEIPGWQHIGDESWQDQAVENTREMVLQYRNHPSVILWGVRINESADCDELYSRTNAAARELDPSRATSGVRNFERSHLLEDVYAFNDFSHTGDNPGAEGKKRVMGASEKPLMITEHNGHMFPAKSFDTWQRRQEHALRHARVQDAAAGDGGHVGCFGWCMFDYPTHKDFGSGDRVCYHGVMDAFRNPKLASYLYASQQEKRPILAVGSSMDIGDYPAGNLGEVAVFTNADEVKLYKNGVYVSSLDKGSWKGLPHGPMELTDSIGELLVTQEGYPEKKANLLKKALLSAAKYGLVGMPLMDKLRMVYAMLRYRMTLEDGVALYGKYVGNWGGEATVWRFDAIRDGQVVKSVTCSPDTQLRTEVTVSHIALREGDTYDMAAVRIRILDANGNVATYAQLPVKLALEGPLELAGPDVVCAEGGMCGTYVRTAGKPGEAVLTVSAGDLEPVTVSFTIQ
ncbi:MAG: glycoside hydrolase family 2 protein [Oscillospiraceae bacterium]|nr:glycoside hydrolase family 2 protein [Oscillospiraceae bacterium]